MPTFYAPELRSDAAAFTLPEDESKHAVRVLRLGAGDAVELLNGRGDVFQAQVADANPKRCGLRVVGHRAVPPPAYAVHLAVAPTKNLDRMEWLLEKITEIGVQRVSFLRCARSERRELKLDRLEKIAVSALKQSGQAWLPELTEMVDFERFLAALENPASAFIAHLAAGERVGLAQVVASRGAECCVLIGPEGDFTPEEIAAARARGVRPVALGASRLRTETAALVAVHTVHVARELAG